MNKHTYILLYILLIAVLTACSNTDTPKYRIGVSQCSSDDWRSKMNDEIMLEMKFHPEAEVDIRSAHDNSRQQIADIRYFIDNDYDIIVAAPNEAEAVTPVLREAYRRGIPVLTFDREMADSSYTANIEVDNYGLGRSAAEYMLHNTSGPVQVIEIKGAPGMSPSKLRNDGFVDVLAAEPRADIVAEATGDWQPDIAAHVADSMLRAHPHANVIYAHNDRMAIAASETARRLGRHDMIVIGIDGTPEIGIKAVADSLITATFLYPTNGELIARTAMDILEGRDFQRNKVIPPLAAVDIQNAEILLQQHRAITDGTQKIGILDQRLHDYHEMLNSRTVVLYCLAAIVALLAILSFLMVRAFWTRRQYQKVLELQNTLLQSERDKQKELYEELDRATSAKLVFFTNVSHDLRTPLTLIAEPVDQLASNPDLSEDQQHTLLQIANKNVKILRRLIDQVLDFRRYENGKLNLHLTEVDIAGAVREWTDAFVPIARRRSIKLTVDIDTAACPTAAVDADKLERVFFNLVSNAFRHTPDNASIKVSVKTTTQTLTLCVADNGEGISEADLPCVFDRFFQADKTNPKGSGIGLALCKAFVELHGGKISVTSKYGDGAEFIVELPIQHVETQATSSLPSIERASVEVELAEARPDTLTPDTSKPWLLAIDDNTDILRMLATLFGDTYNVITASNGRQGIRMANKYVPDIIVCDVMMPEMDGMECLRTLKSEVRTSHIPILMLTACRLDEQRVEGYMAGADGYLSKPFVGSVLRARIEALLENRRRVADAYRMPGGADTVQKQVQQRPTDKSVLPGKLDNDFYARFIEVLDREMGKSDLSVEDLAGHMGLGQSQFTRKIKALTNFTPVELLRRKRLERAATLLTTTDRSISEISYTVGFTSPAYFTKCYRDAFGETPTDVRARTR